MKTKKKGKNMKIKLIVLTLVLAIAGPAYTDVIGGYVNTEEKEFAIVYDAITSQQVLLGASLESIILNRGSNSRFGKLYIVYPNGYSKISYRPYRDRYGISIAAPHDSYDKIVYVDYYARIVGGIGLGDGEIFNIASKHRAYEAAENAELVTVERQSDLYEGVELAAGSVRSAYRMEDRFKRQMFSGAVETTSGSDVRKVVDGIIAASNTDSFPFASLEELLFDNDYAVETEPLIIGVDIIEHGDNGGGGDGLINHGDNGGGGNGLVAHGDNGGGGNGLINHGDNGGGGNGLVAHGDNGGGGNGLCNDESCAGVVVHGFSGEAMPTIPLPNINATLHGTIIYVM